MKAHLSVANFGAGSLSGGEGKPQNLPFHYGHHLLPPSVTAAATATSRIRQLLRVSMNKGKLVENIRLANMLDYSAVSRWRNGSGDNDETEASIQK